MIIVELLVAFSGAVLWAALSSRRHARPPVRQPLQPMKQVISVRDLEEMLRHGKEEVLRHGKDVRSLHAEALLTPSRRNAPLRSMSEYHKCTCPHCGQSIEYPAEGTGQTVPCPTCEKPFGLFPEIAIPAVQITVAPAPVQKPVDQNTVASEPAQKPIEQKRRRSLHQAAKTGQFGEIPSHLLSIELFKVKNKAGETPLHVAARRGHLDQVPLQFLTKETMTIKKGDGSYLTGSGKVAYMETPLHMAVHYGYADQIPRQFLTPEFLSLRATGYQLTVLHELAYRNQLDLVPEEYADSDIWKLADYIGRTAHDVIQEKERRATYVSQVRSEQATEKQKEKLRYFGYTVRPGITKGEASDAIDEYVRRFPERDREYYDRPATEEQMAKLKRFAETDEDMAIGLQEVAEEGSQITYGQAKDWLWQCEMDQRQREEEREATYRNSEECKIEDMTIWFNDFGDYTRDVTRDEAAKAWALIKSDRPVGAALPKQIEVENALEKLNPDLIKPKRPGVLWHNYCHYCRGQIEVMMPPYPIIHTKPTPEDVVSILVVCPHCNRETKTRGPNTFVWSCPNCSKRWSLLKSQAGKHLKCGNCQQDFLAVPTGVA